MEFILQEVCKDGIQLPPLNNIAGTNVYEVTLSLNAGDVHEYKFINGNLGADESVWGWCAAGNGNRLITVPNTAIWMLIFLVI